MELHSKDNRVLRVHFRLFEPKDVNEVIACIRDEYGDTYFKRDFYSPEYIIEAHETGHIHFIVAQTDEGDIAGFMILKHFLPDEQMIEIASQIFKKKYRGFGMAKKLFDYGMELLEDMPCSGIYCLPVTFHAISQRLLNERGLRATGFIFSIFDMEKIKQSFGGFRNKKHGQAVQVKAKDKQRAGVLYVPREHRAFTEEVYSRLNVSFSLESILQIPEGIDTEAVCTSDFNNANCAVIVTRPGMNIVRCVTEKLAPCLNMPGITCNVFLNINSPYAVFAYRQLRKQGFFFTGYKALCSEREYMILHHPMDVKIDFRDFAVSNEFQWVLDYIEPLYHERMKAKEEQGDEVWDKPESQEGNLPGISDSDCSAGSHCRLRNVFYQQAGDGYQ